MIDNHLREHWWAAVASVTRAVGDLATAEDAVQEACVAALRQWPTDGVPPNPRAWLISTARHKALDVLRREAKREAKEGSAVREPEGSDPDPRGDDPAAESVSSDQLGLIFMCCHPALDPQVGVGLTLRAVCGLTTEEIAAVFLVREPTMSKRLVRARRKIRESGIGLAMPDPEALVARLSAVLRVIYLVFTAGHRSISGPELVREDLCATAITLARTLNTLLPGQPEVGGLLALLLLTDARRAARTDEYGEVVLLAQQDRRRYDPAMIVEGEQLLDCALRAGRPGPYLIQAAIAACHTTAATAADTDWREIAALYGELLRYEPSAVHEANRAIAVAMAEGPAAGLVVLDAVAHHPELARWSALHAARADLLVRLGRTVDAATAYRAALQLDPPSAERTFIHRQLARLDRG